MRLALRTIMKRRGGVDPFPGGRALVRPSASDGSSGERSNEGSILKRYPMQLTRRAFLKGGGIAMVGIGALPSFLTRAIASTPMPNRKILVVVFQRGAADGLN